MVTNRNGMSALIALGFLAFITIVATSVQSLMSNSDKGKKLARIRFATSILENRIRLKLSLPETYTCAPITIPSGTETRCDLPANFWDQFKKSVPGSKCAAGTSFCGIQILNGPDHIQGAAPPFRFNNLSVSYNGEDLRLNPIIMEPIEIPPEAIINSASGACPTLGDIFKGIKKDGTPVCEPKPSCQALEGHYFAGLDPNGKAICKPLNGIDFDISGNITRIPGLACPKSSDGSQKYLESIQFNCHTSSKSCRIDIICKERVDPCAIEGSGTFCPL